MGNIKKQRLIDHINEIEKKEKDDEGRNYENERNFSKRN